MALLVAAGGLLLLPRLSGRLGSRLAPGAAILLVFVLPWVAIVALDLFGKHTLATRNLIVLAPVVAALVGGGLAAAGRWPGSLGAALLLTLALWGLTGLPRFHLRPPWSRVGDFLDATTAEPLASPGWMARCVEYHSGRAWDSVFDSYRPNEVRAWAGERSGVVLVQAYRWIADPEPIREVLREHFGAPRIERIERITGEVYGEG